jgi:hypothetical protein
MTDTTTPNAADIELGARVRRNYDKGRAIAHANSRARLEASTAVVRAALDIDMIDGSPVYGRASRIARKTGIKRRTVDRILATLMSVAKS